MKRPLIIFGVGNIGELAHYYFSSDSDYVVAGFTVDVEFRTSETFCNLPVVAFDEVANRFPADEYDLFVAISYNRLNALRKEKYLAAKAMGYKLASYVSSKATVLNDKRIGENCFVLEDNTIQPFVTIGNNVTLWSGNHIGHHTVIEDHCFVASHVVISGGVTIGESCFIGVNATLRDHITVGERCVIGAAVLLLESAEPEGVYIGTGTTRASVPSSKLRRI